MLKTPLMKKTLMAITATATLLIALPSQAGRPYCPNPYGYGYGYDNRYDNRYDDRYDRRPVRKVVVVKKVHYDYDDHRGDRRWDRDDRRDYRWDDRRYGR